MIITNIQSLIKALKQQYDTANTMIEMELFNAILLERTARALQIIESGHYDPEYIDSEGYTALILACRNNMPDVAMALISTGNAKPEYVNMFGKTALIWACYNDMPDVALALIATGKSKPEQANNNGSTALICACRNNMPIIALALIASGQSKPEQINKIGATALTYAKRNNMTDVINVLENYDNYMASLQQIAQSNPYDDPNYVMTINI